MGIETKAVVGSFADSTAVILKSFWESPPMRETPGNRWILSSRGDGVVLRSAQSRVVKARARVLHGGHAMGGTDGLGRTSAREDTRLRVPTVAEVNQGPLPRRRC